MEMTTAGYHIDALTYSHGSIACLKDLSVRLAPGHFYGLIGPNGSGKSTLLDLLGGYLTPTNGKISLDQLSLEAYPRRSFARKVASVPQTFSLNFAYPVKDIVLMGRYPYIGRFSPPQEADIEAVETAMTQMEVAELKERPVTRLSGGEKQRVMLARALAQQTEYILLDEVTANLDINHAIAIMRKMAKLVREEGRTVITALHDLNMALAYCDHVLVLHDSRLHRFGPTEEVITRELIYDLYQISADIYDASGTTSCIRFPYQ